jgi:hypothetical protein
MISPSSGAILILFLTIDGKPRDDFFDEKVSLDCTAALRGAFVDLAQNTVSP